MQAGAALTSFQWQKTKVELGEAVEKMKRGYWGRQRSQDAAKAEGDPEANALEVHTFLSLTINFDTLTVSLLIPTSCTGGLYISLTIKLIV
jgi:hypothetical protein